MMRKIEYLLAPPEEWYKVLHQQLPSTLQNNQLVFDRKLGKGKLQYSILQDGIWAHQMNFEFDKSLKLHRQPKAVNDCFAISFYLSNSEISHEGHQSSTFGLQNMSILLNSATVEMEINIPAQQAIRIFNIGFTREWLKANLLKGENIDKLGSLFLSDDPIYLSESLDFKFKSIINELDLNKVGRLRLFSGVLQLLDYMVIKLQKRASGSLVPANIHYEDFQHLLKAKSILDASLEKSVAVEVLAQEASMSLSKFKRLFKQVFGTTPYQYYLENRMEKAKEMLVLGQQTVSEVGFLIGYSNLSQFTKAFKKHHSILPSEILRAFHQRNTSGEAETIGF